MQLILWLGVLSGALDPTGTIAFVDGTNTSEARVCVLDIETGVKTNVGPGHRDGAPRWSPDGSWLVFETGDIDDARSIYVVRPDGTDGRILEHEQRWNVEPRWAIDGRRVVYNSGRGALSGIVVYDLNSGEESVWGGGVRGLLRPVWMPYNKLKYMLEPDSEIEDMDVNIVRFLSEARMNEESVRAQELPEVVVALQVELGKSRRRNISTTAVLVTENEVLPFLGLLKSGSGESRGVLWQVEPSWEDWQHENSPSPAQGFGGRAFSDVGEAKRIAFESNESGDREIFVIGSKGKANVTNHRAADWNPVWAPDGRRMAFESFRNGQRGIYQVFTDTSLVRPLVEEEGASWSPAWSPDGRWVVFVSNREGNAELYVASESRGPSQRLTSYGGSVAWPSWCPEQER